MTHVLHKAFVLLLIPPDATIGFDLGCKGERARIYACRTRRRMHCFERQKCGGSSDACIRKAVCFKLGQCPDSQLLAFGAIQVYTESASLWANQ